MDSSEDIAFGEKNQNSEKNEIGICLSDPISGRLLEGICAQLGVIPVFLTAAEIFEPRLIQSLEMLVTERELAMRFRAVSRLSENPRDVLTPALVAVIPLPSSEESLKFPSLEGDPAFDGLLTLPLPPAMVMAQLGVILYAHRANMLRMNSAMEELHLNRRIFRSVTSGISVASATGPDHLLTYVNPAFEMMTGYSLEEVVGRNCRFLQGKDRNQPGLTLVREAIQLKRETVAVIRNFRKNGEPFWNELLLSPIRDRSGEVTHFVGIQNDVTARVAFEEALRESEKLATAGRLAASIAHEINNPLAAVTNLIYLARDKNCEAEMREQFLAMAETELARVSLLTTQSLRFYRQSTKPQAVKPTELISSVLDVYWTKLKHTGIQLERRDNMCESIVCLESEIRQVISNLVRNSMDAMTGEAGDRLLVRTREATEWRTKSKGIVITVADTGTGMSKETREKIYTAFYTTKGMQGTGLGLWVSSEIVARHHGRLLVKSCEGKQRHGTVFALFLPYQALVR